jgi:hypothetical protein
MTLDTAAGINDGGQIAGYTLGGANPHAWLLTPSTGGQAPMAPAIVSLGNTAISAADLGGRTPGLAGETVHGSNVQAPFNDATNASGWGRYVDQTPHNDAQMANTQERLVRRAFETDDAGEWAWILDTMLPEAF